MFLLLQNFVGLSVSDGYIATGSETNEAFHLSLSLVYNLSFNEFLLMYFSKVVVRTLLCHTFLLDYIITSDVKI